ncbi:glycosyltransferase family 39 protein [Bradyrhizobium sp.]|uniref:glycosyltransferase family 39 protein n=1 Tax=Bradyrhizobium sp. TaxID=376 RepID=UPI002D32CDA4|nr:glycosyltransferase family 39 protein [Bradyrhizobium sp.]HZR74137.1 glycosyltransferase family 39 protein [Bradyrhizobium sp.]
MENKKLSQSLVHADVAETIFSFPDQQRSFLRTIAEVDAGWVIPLLLCGFVAGWQAFLSIAYIGGDLHPDVLETWTLGRSIEWGSAKHPPLMSWIARAWTSVFPLANWSFQLMALTNSAIALWIVDLIARRFVQGDKRLIVLLLLMLTPIYQFHAQRFNANSVLLATWPLATYCFLRSFETRRLGWAVAAGAAAALAMLGKYYSVFLIAGFVFAAILHQERRAYFSSAAPWVSMITGLAVLGPHLHWLATTGAKPFSYALATHAGKPFGRSLADALLFAPGATMVLALPAAAWVLIAGSRLRTFRQDFLALDEGLWLLFLVSIGTIVFPPIAALVLKSDLQPIWALQGLFLFVILVVCGASYPIEHVHTVRLAVTAFAIATLSVVVVAPGHALYRNSYPLHEGRNFYRKAAEELTRRWHLHSDETLQAIGGDGDLAFAVAFYSPDHPLYERPLVNPNTEPTLDAALLGKGWAALCFDEDDACINAVTRTLLLAPRFVSHRFKISSSLLGQPGASQSFMAVIVPPATQRETAPTLGLAANFSVIRQELPF